MVLSYICEISTSQHSVALWQKRLSDWYDASDEKTVNYLNICDTIDYK